MGIQVRFVKVYFFLLLIYIYILFYVLILLQVKELVVFKAFDTLRACGGYLQCQNIEVALESALLRALGFISHPLHLPSILRRTSHERGAFYSHQWICFHIVAVFLSSGLTR